MVIDQNDMQGGRVILVQQRRDGRAHHGGLVPRRHHGDDRRQAAGFPHRPRDAEAPVAAPRQQQVKPDDEGEGGNESYHGGAILRESSQ
jgi:hypothetical protein